MQQSGLPVYIYPEPQQALCNALLVQDLLAEMLRIAEAAADRERHSGASAGEVCTRRGSMAADICTQVFGLAGVVFLFQQRAAHQGLVQPESNIQEQEALAVLLPTLGCDVFACRSPC